MHHIRNPWFWPLVLLFTCEVALAVQYQVLVCLVPLAGTLLLLITLPSTDKDDNERPKHLFYRACGGVAFIAVIFVNTTHALEMLTEAVDTAKSEHHHGHDEGGHLPIFYIPLSLVDLLLKSFLLFSHRIPRFGLHRNAALVLLGLPSVVVLALVASSYSLHLTDSWWWEHMNPLSTLLLMLLSVALSWPHYRELRPFLFSESPREFDIAFFKKDIYTKFPNVRVSHVHVYRVWPKHSSEAVVHLSIEVDKSSSMWSTVAQSTFKSASAFTRDVLHTTAGTNKITIEPRFVDSRSPSSAFSSCVTAQCDGKEKTCCGRAPQPKEACA